MSAARQKDYKSAGERADGHRRTDRVTKTRAANVLKRNKLLAQKRIRYGDGFVPGDLEEDAVLTDEQRAAKLQAVLEGLSTDAPGSLRSLRTLLALGSAYIEAFVGTPGAVEQLVKLLAGADTQLQACWCVTNIAASSAPTHTEAIAVASPYLIQLLEANSEDVQEQALWALGNMAANGLELREKLLAQGFGEQVLRLLASEHPIVVQRAAFACTILAHGDGSAAMLLEAGVAPRIAEALKLHLGNLEVVEELCWIVTHLTAGNAEAVACLSGLNVIPAIANLLLECAKNSVDTPIVLPLIRTLGNTVNVASEEIVDALLSNAEYLTAAGQYMRSELRPVKLETAWLFAGALGGSGAQAKAVVDCGVVPELIAAMSGPNLLRREAAYALVNLASHGPEPVSLLFDTECPAGFVKLLQTPDLELVDVSLKFFELSCRFCPERAITTLLESDGGDIIETLMYHDREGIANHARWLVDNHLSQEEEPLAVAADFQADFALSLQAQAQAGEAGKWDNI